MEIVDEDLTLWSLQRVIIKLEFDIRGFDKKKDYVRSRQIINC